MLCNNAKIRTINRFVLYQYPLVSPADIPLNNPLRRCQMTIGVSGVRCFPTRVEWLRERAEPDIFWTSSKCWARVVKCCSWGGRGWKGGRQRGRKQATSTQILTSEGIPTSAPWMHRSSGRPVKGRWAAERRFSSLKCADMWLKCGWSATG